MVTFYNVFGTLYTRYTQSPHQEKNVYTQRKILGPPTDSSIGSFASPLLHKKQIHKEYGGKFSFRKPNCHLTWILKTNGRPYRSWRGHRGQRLFSTLTRWALVLHCTRIDKCAMKKFIINGQWQNELFWFLSIVFHLQKLLRMLRAFVDCAKTVLATLTSAQWC